MQNSSITQCMGKLAKRKKQKTEKGEIEAAMQGNHQLKPSAPLRASTYPRCLEFRSLDKDSSIEQGVR